MNDRVRINGFEVGPSTDLPSLLRKQLLGGAILGGRYDESPDPGIWNLFGLASGTAVEPRLIQATKDLLADPDPQVRAGAVGIVQAYAEKFDGEALLKILQRNPALFDSPAKSTDPRANPKWGLLRAIAGTLAWRPEVTAQMRLAVLDREGGLNVLAGVLVHDTDWAIDHAGEVIGEQPDRARIFLFRLKSPTLRERFIRSIPLESPKLRKIVRDAVIEEVKDKAEQDKLLKLLSS